MSENVESVAERVCRAQAGDLDAWATIVEEFQDVAAGLAAGWSGDWTIADDVAQEAFIVAFLHLHELIDPQAFPAWFARVVRSAMTRHLRGERRGSTVEWGDDAEGDPAEAAIANDESRRLRDAVELLPAHERSVVALHYLAGMSYPEVAEALRISVSAARKRAHSARCRLETLLRLASGPPTSARPSRHGRLRDSVVLFLAIRQHDHELVRALLTNDPTLVSVTEAWSKDEAMHLGLQHAEHGTPLVRAVQTGDAALVRLLLDAGAAAEQPCGCAGAESALWTATLYGEAEIVELLLAAGADPNVSAFASATPAVVAAQRDDHDITRLLLAAGADPSRPDSHGRSADDWLRLRAARSDNAARPELLATGVRSLDLFAPIMRGTVQWWPAAWELGQFALLTEIVRSVAPGEFWQVGFATGSYNEESGRQWQRQVPVATRLRLTPGGSTRAERRTHFESVLREMCASPRGKIVMLLTAPGHHHDITLAVARLKPDSSVLAAIVVEPATSDTPAPGGVVPEGFDAQVSFDPTRALRQLWPAVAALRTRAVAYPSVRHEQLAEGARGVLEQYEVMDATLEMRQPETYSDERLAVRAQALHRFFAQPFALWEHVTAVPGESTPYNELLDSVETLLT